MQLFRLLKRDIHKETHNWVNDGLVSTEQAEKICARYGVDYSDESAHSYGYYVLMTLGYLFIGLSIITVMGANWEDIPRAVRMGTLVGTTLFFNLLGLNAYRQGRVNAAIGWFFLGGLLYGASIMLIAQIYHIGEHFPDGIYFWALGVLPIALLLRSNVLMMLTMALAFTWFFAESGGEFFPITFPLFLVATGWLVMRGKQSTVLFLAMMVGMSFYVEYLAAWQLTRDRHFDFEVENLLVGGALFLFYAGLAKFMAARGDDRLTDYATVLSVWVLRFTLVFMFVFSFEEPWKDFLDEDWRAGDMMLVIVMLSSVLSVGLAWLGRREAGDLVTTLFFAVLLVGFSFAGIYDLVDSPLVMQILDNVLLVTIGVWLIVMGIRRGITHYFYLGILVVMGNGLMRYIDFVGDYVGAAILFFVFAVILLAVARYWRAYQSQMKVAP